MPAKEKVLLAVMVAAVAGLAAIDKRYDRVPVPTPRAPADVPQPPGPDSDPRRFEPPRKRSMFDQYSDLEPPEYVTLQELPVPFLPTAVPPVRPGPHMDAAGSVPRHFLFDPADTASEETAGGTGSSPVEETKPIAEAGTDSAETTKKDMPPPPDLSRFDWVLPVNALAANKIYGHIEPLEADVKVGKDKYELLVDSSQDFNLRTIDLKTGKITGVYLNYRQRTAELGFADTIENNYLARRRRLEYSIRPRTLDPVTLQELVKWSLEQADLPKYSRRAAWGYAAKDLQDILRRRTDDKETLKQLGRVYRLLQDLESEVRLYDWWLEAQKIAQDPEVLALSAETNDLLGLRDRARQRYEKALVANSDPRLRLRLADLLLATGSLEDAERAAREFQAAASSGERLAGTLGEVRARLALGQRDAAEQALGRIASGDRDAAWYAAMGSVQYARGRLEEARGNFQAAFEKSRAGDESLGVARTDLAVVKGRLAAAMPEVEGSTEARRAAVAEAQKAAEDALRDDPLNYYWPLVARAYASRAGGERDRSVETLQEAVAALPQEAYGRYLLGEFLLRDGRAAEARTQFLESSRLAPRFPDALGGVGRAGGGEPGEAKEYLRRAAELDPKNGLWPLLSARMSILDEGMPPAQRLEEARKDLTSLLENVDRSSYYGQIYLGWVRYYQGDAEDALQRWNAAIRLVQAQKATSPREQALLDALAAWLKDAVQKVSKWQKTRIWTDRFKRPDGETVGNEWNEDEKSVKIRLEGEHVQIGRPSERLGADEKPVLWRERDQARVLKWSLTVHVDPSEPVEVDTRFWIPQGNRTEAMVLGVRKTEAGDLRLLLKRDQRDKTVQILEIAGMPKWPEDGRIKFGFVKKNDEKGIIALFVNDKPVPGYEEIPDVQTLIRSHAGKIRAEVRCTGLQGTTVNVQVLECVEWRDVE